MDRDLYSRYAERALNEVEDRARKGIGEGEMETDCARETMLVERYVRGEADVESVDDAVSAGMP